MRLQSFIIFILIISFTTYSSAGAACLIKDKPAPALLEYIKDNRTVIKNITTAIVDSKNKKDDENRKIENNSSKYEQLKKKTSDDFDNAGAESASIFNEIFNFSGYYSYFKYYVTYPIFNEVPFQVKRDYSLLDKENKGLVNYLKTLDKNGDSSTIVVNACEGVINGIETCKEKLNDKEAKKIIGLLIQNSDFILDLYRNSIIGGDGEYEDEKFILINESFIEEIEWVYYSQIAVSECNSEEGGFFERITTSIDDIKLINKQGEDGIKKWKDAFALLLGNAPDGEEEKIAQKQLKEYLSQNGVPSDKQDIIMKNLADAEADPFSFNNNFIENTFSSTLKKVKKDLALWKKQNIGNSIPKDVKKISINTLKKVTTNADVSRNIEETIDQIYESELPFIGIGNITTETLRSKIISSHVSIQNSIKTLENTIIISSKVCKSQGGGGICD